MLVLGIVIGIAAALLQAISYVCSSYFMQKHPSSLQMTVDSQIVMGAISLCLLPFLYPAGLEGLHLEFLKYILVWIVVFFIAQASFFKGLAFVESSRMSSLQGLRIIVLALISVFFLHRQLNPGQWSAIAVSTVAAFLLNWSGGKRFSPQGIFWLVMTLIFYSLTNMAENHLVLMPRNDSVILSACGVVAACYAVLGLCSIPMLFKFVPSRQSYLDVLPFCFTWLLSQIAMIACFGLLGTVFGNVIQSIRGVISIGLGVLLMHFGLGYLDAVIDRKAWLKRLVAGILMTAGIILYALATK